MILKSLLLATSLICAWMSHSSAEGMTIPWSGQANGNLILRSSPPSGPFYRKGDQIGIVQQGEMFRVLEWEIINTLFETQQWLRIQRETETGWIYNGVSQDSRPYVEPVNPGTSSGDTEG